MIKNSLLILFSLINISLFSQNSYDINQRKGGLFFSVGSEYLITPIHSSTTYSTVSFTANPDTQNSGVAFFYSFDYFLSKKLSIGFANTIRYGLHYNTGNQIQGDFGFEGAKNTLIFGYHFYLDYHFKVFKNSEIFIRFGTSFVNRGTNAIRKQNIYDDTGNLEVTVLSSFNFAYQPWNFGLGYKKNKISILGGIYSTSNTNYFDDNASFIVPYIQFKYNLGKL